MSFEWDVTTVHESIELNPSYSLKKGSLAKKIAMADIDPFTRKVSNYEVEEFKGGSKFKNGDTLLARITPCLENGKTAFVSVLQDGEIGFGSTEFIVMKGKKGISDDKYVYYLSISPEFRNIAIKSMSGTSGRQRAQIDAIAKWQFKIPPLHEQKKISVVLSSIDDKIELNNAINKNLEEMAQALFKRWFVDFEFPNENGEPYRSSGGEFEESELGLIPKGWRVGTIVDIARYKRDTIKPQDIPSGTAYVGLEHVPRKQLTLDSFGISDDIESNKTCFSKGDILFGKLRPYFHKVSVAPIDGVCSTDIIAINVLESSFYGYLVLHLFSEKLVDYATQCSNGTKMPRTNWKDISRYSIVIPEVSVANDFTIIFNTLINKSQNNTFENQLLSQLRDFLLPKLMSGEIRVPK